MHKQEWISVKERTPKEGERVLILNEDGWIDISRSFLVIVLEHLDWCDSTKVVTHWMPLPKLPK
jgi:hypothetical protein